MPRHLKLPYVTYPQEAGTLAVTLRTYLMAHFCGVNYLRCVHTSYLEDEKSSLLFQFGSGYNFY